MDKIESFIKYLEEEKQRYENNLKNARFFQDTMFSANILAERAEAKLEAIENMLIELKKER